MVAAADEVEAARRFTRFFTRQTDLLNEGLLESRFSLTEARILYELAHRADPTAAELARDLGIDRGYLSRILARFDADGLVARTPSPSDARRSRLRLTPAGAEAFRPLDQKARAQVARWLAPLPVADRTALLSAMAVVERVLSGTGAQGSALTMRGLRIGDAGWIARRQGMIYAEEYGWDATFEAAVAEILASFVRSFDPARARAWIAERGGEIVGSVFLVRVSDEVAQLRLLYVEAAMRGSGLGRRLVGECIAGARERGYRVLTLWTNDCLDAARRIYQTTGFQLIEEERHHSFGQDLVGQNWSLDL